MPGPDGGPLSNVRVIDAGHVVAGPFAGTLLADLGADVIKIEEPARGDTIRSLGPRYKGAPLWWKVAGRNKRSLALDLRTKEGRDILLRLVEKSDALIENFRSGTLERWELGPEVLWEANPRLVILRISGFGQSGSGAARPGFGRVGEAMSGAVNLTGEANSRPLHVGFSLGDAASGLMGAFGIMVALHAARETGRGDLIDLALFESLFRMIEWQIPVAEKLGHAVTRQGNVFPLGYAVAGSYLTRDGRWVTISSATNEAIRRILRLVGGDQLADDPRLADFEVRSVGDRLHEIDRRVAEWIRLRDAEEVVEAFRAQDIAVGVVYDAAMMLDDPLFAERGAIVEVDDPELGATRMPGVVPRLLRNPGAVRWAGPRLGEHNEEILCGLLGLTREEVERLRATGVVGSAPGGEAVPQGLSLDA